MFWMQTSALSMAAPSSAWTFLLTSRLRNSQTTLVSKYLPMMHPDKVLWKSHQLPSISTRIYTTPIKDQEQCGACWYAHVDCVYCACVFILHPSFILTFFDWYPFFFTYFSRTSICITSRRAISAVQQIESEAIKAGIITPSDPLDTVAVISW